MNNQGFCPCNDEVREGLCFSRDILSVSNLTEKEERHVKQITPQENLSLKSLFKAHRRIYQETLMLSRESSEDINRTEESSLGC